MNAPRCTEHDYIAFLIAAQRVYSCTEAARCQPDVPDAPAHDAFTCLLARVPPDTAALWAEAEPFVRRREGILVLDDTTLDKPYAKRMDLVTTHWSGKHRRIVDGINLQTLVWTGPGLSDQRCVVPVDVRLYQAKGPTKNEQVREMLTVAAERGFEPACVCFDAWYSGLDNLKLIRDFGWDFLTQVRSNRTVDPDRTGHVAVSSVEVGPFGRVVHLKGFGFVRLFRTEPRDGRAEYWITNRTAMTEAERAELSHESWQIEAYHRSLKQHCGVERSQVRSAIGQGNHILLSVRAFLRLEVHRLRAGVSHFEAKACIVRDALRSFLASPNFTALTTA